MVGDTKRQANSREVTDLKKENGDLKQRLTETMLKNNVFKKVRLAQGRTRDVE